MNITPNNLVAVLVEMSQKHSTNYAVEKMQSFLKRRNADYLWSDIKQQITYQLESSQDDSATKVTLGAKLDMADLPSNSSVDSALIGGFMIEEGDNLTDASLATQLTNLKKTLTN